MVDVRQSGPGPVPPHRALGLEPPVPRVGPTAITSDQRCVDRRDQFGGLLYEYHIKLHDRVSAPYGQLR
jgi:hypothetical protein